MGIGRSQGSGRRREAESFRKEARGTGERLGQGLPSVPGTSHARERDAGRGGWAGVVSDTLSLGVQGDPIQSDGGVWSSGDGGGQAPRFGKMQHPQTSPSLRPLQPSAGASRDLGFHLLGSPGEPLMPCPALLWMQAAYPEVVPGSSRRGLRGCEAGGQGDPRRVGNLAGYCSGEKGRDSNQTPRTRLRGVPPKRLRCSMPGTRPEANHIIRQGENTAGGSSGPGGQRQNANRTSLANWLRQARSGAEPSAQPQTDSRSSKDFLLQASRSRSCYNKGNHPHPLSVHTVREELTPFPSSSTAIVNQYALHPGILAAATASQMGM